MDQTARNKLRVEKQDGGVALLIINNPEKRNAIDREVFETFPLILETLDRDDEVKAIVLTGQGEHFCSGGDLSGAKGVRTVEERRDVNRQLGKMVRTIQHMEKPVIAMVRGFAVGGGMSLVLACDMVYAETEAKFSTQFIRLGIFPEMGSLFFLPLIAGVHRAKELLFSAKLFDAQEAYRIGIVNQVLPKERLETETLAFAREIAGMPSLPIRMSKRLMNTTLLNQLDQVLEWEAQATPLSSLTKDFEERLAAFKTNKVGRINE